MPAGSTATELGTFPVATVPADVKAPVAVLIVYIETSFEPELTTYANLPAGSTATETGFIPVAIVPVVPVDAKAPFVALTVYVITLPVDAESFPVTAT